MKCKMVIIIKYVLCQEISKIIKVLLYCKNITNFLNYLIKDFLNYLIKVFKSI